MRSIKSRWFWLLPGLLLPVVSWAQDAHEHPSTDISAELSTLAAHAGDQATIAVIVNVHEGLHAQSHTPVDEYAIKFEMSGDKNPLVQFGDVEYPPAQEKTFPSLGKLSVYEGRTVVLLPVTISKDAKPGGLTIKGRLSYQACNNDACFSPENPLFTIETQIVPQTQTVVANPAFPAPEKVPATTMPVSAKTGTSGSSSR